MTEPNQGQQETVQGEDDQSSPGPQDFTIALYSDPGRTSMWVRRLLDDRGEGWSRGAEVVHQQTLLPLRHDGTLDLPSVQQWTRNDEADITVVITEIPRMAGRKPKVAELHFADRLAIISFPALGPIRVRSGLRRELRRCVDALVHDSVDHARAQGGLTSSVEDQEGYRTYYTTPKGPLPGRTWTTLGMVAANEPLWALPKLSGVFAAAAATGAFGIFFSTIWEMATFLPVWRLAVVALIAVVVMVLWLLLSNRLWDRPGRVGSKREALMYNASTVVSLTVSVAALYLLLFVGILSVGLLLIDPEFMSNTVNEEASFGNYVQIAWLSASMGTVAGAIGSNFDSDATLKHLTQGSREAQRYPRDEEQS